MLGLQSAMDVPCTGRAMTSSQQACSLAVSRMPQQQLHASLLDPHVTCQTIHRALLAEAVAQCVMLCTCLARVLFSM